MTLEKQSPGGNRGGKDTTHKSEQILSSPMDGVKPDMLETARSYVAYNWSVIPLLFREKKPAIAWKEYQSRLPTDAELVEWFVEGKAHNIGIVTGAVSGLAVIDLDSPEALERAKAQGMPSGGPVVRTGKGYHAYCRYREGVGNTADNGVDIRGEGGFVVAPPSVHPSGAVYALAT